MATEYLLNNCATTLNGGINASVTTITVSSAAAMAAQLPSTNYQFRVIVETALGAGTGEIMLCIGISGNVLTVVRNYETNGGAGSNPQSFLTGASLSCQITAGGIASVIAQGGTASAWSPFSYLNSWVSNAGPATGDTVAGYMTIGNLVLLGGTIKSGTSASSAIQMPAGTWPTRALLIPTFTTATPTVCMLAVSTAGVITPTFAGGTVPTLDGVEWTTV